MGNRLSSGGIDVAQTRTAYSELQQMGSKYGELAADAALAAGGALPPPAGTAVDIVSLGKSLITQDWGGALFDVIGFVPLVGDAAKATKIGNKLNDIRKALDVARTAMSRQFQRTREIALKYWDDLAQARRADYDKAIKSCTTKKCRQDAALLKGPQYANTPTDGPNGNWVGDRGDSVWQPANGGPPVEYRGGFPEYGPHSSGNVEIPMRGNHTTDFTAADKAMRESLGDPNWRRPSTHTWHHNQDGVTMQLIPKSVHATGGGASTPHMGGASLYTGSNATEF